MSAAPVADTQVVPSADVQTCAPFPSYPTATRPSFPAATDVSRAPSNPGPAAALSHAEPSADVHAAAPEPSRPTATNALPSHTTAFIDPSAKDELSGDGVQVAASVEVQ